MSDAALGGLIYWEDLAKQLADVWWEVSKVGGTLQHGELDRAGTMFSVALEQHGGRCFHGDTPLDAWRKARDWLVSPDRPTYVSGGESVVANCLFSDGTISNGPSASN
jgi:hypothetical protein